MTNAGNDREHEKNLTDAGPGPARSGSPQASRLTVHQRMRSQRQKPPRSTLEPLLLRAFATAATPTMANTTASENGGPVLDRRHNATSLECRPSAIYSIYQIPRSLYSHSGACRPALFPVSMIRYRSDRYLSKCGHVYSSTDSSSC